jgi:hypothetical protein
VAATAGMVALAGISSWLLAAERRGPVPSRDFAPRPLTLLALDGPDAAAVRAELLRRAHFRYTPDRPPAPLPAMVECQYLKDEPTGTTPKFDCVLDGGEVIKVKYNSNPEIHAEVAATRLLDRLGYVTDRMDIVRRVRCYGCPRYPFFTMQVLATVWATGLLPDRGLGDGYTDFEWVAVERKFDAPAIETADTKGWRWYELDDLTIPRAEIDAFRLLAVFLAHWDNKSDNQRLVCLDADRALPCAAPLAMIQDLGATFGPSKVNLARWRDLPVWADRRACEVTMRHLPWSGATFGTARISEEGRVMIARQLAALTDEDVRTLFADARFPAFHPGTDDQRDLTAWTEAFRYRAAQIAAGAACPTVSPSRRRSSVPYD